MTARRAGFWRTAALLAVPLGIGVSGVRADAPAGPDPIATERPGFNNGTETVLPGTLQLELGYSYSYSGSGETHVSQIGNGAQLRIPISDRSEVRFGLPSYQWAYTSGAPTQSGLTDSTISAKLRFLDGITAQRPSLAVIAGTTLPTGADAFRENHTQPFAALEVTEALSELWTLQASTTYADARNDGVRFDQFGAGVGVNYAVTSNVATFLEAYRISPTGVGAPNGDYIDGGVTLAAGKNVQYDAAAGKGIATGANPDFYLSVGYSLRF